MQKKGFWKKNVQPDAKPNRPLRGNIDAKRKAPKANDLAATDPNYEQQLAIILPFLMRFSPSFGLSSENLCLSLHRRDA
jgi:hypothetical protein